MTKKTESQRFERKKESAPTPAFNVHGGHEAVCGTFQDSLGVLISSRYTYLVFGWSILGMRDVPQL